MTGIQLPSSQWMKFGFSILAFLLAQLLLVKNRLNHAGWHNIRLGLIFIGIAMAAATSLLYSSSHIWTSLLIFLIIAMEEGIGRWLFYKSRL